MLRSLCLVALLAGCAPPPLEGRLTAADRAAPYPDLVPLGPILAAAPEGGDPEGEAAALEARAAGLRSRAAQVGAPLGPDPALEARAGALRDRAARIRGEVVPEPVQERMDEGVDSAPLP
ncbi:hypothetical protein [Histidinibacterium aquaticum]|uniref:Uncharacterized protein n=1 Tax=Histidinibacterium aquaticum TaxID=2613962 RepID=A0A5J5GQ03_9RHOB|nr:hypothetical protein [Histidinibacterium aquaticum]KAA9010260.1 hypothetical protein F3S47_03140 [Histidinibacterium aquaticum]